MRNRKLCGLFLVNLRIDLDEIQYVATTCWFAEAHAKSVLHKDIHVRKLCWRDFMK